MQEEAEPADDVGAVPASRSERAQFVISFFYEVHSARTRSLGRSASSAQMRDPKVERL